MPTIPITKLNIGGNTGWTADEANLKSSELNDCFNDISNGFTPTYTDDYSTNVAQQKETKDPGEISAEQLPGTLAEELKELRYAIKDCKNTSAEWYTAPSTNLATIAANVKTLDITVNSVNTNVILCDDISVNTLVLSNSSVTITNLTVTNLTIDTLTNANVDFTGNLTISSTNADVSNIFANHVANVYTINTSTDGSDPGIGGCVTSNTIDATTSNGSAWEAIPNSSVIITTHGNPVFVILIAANDGTNSFISPVNDPYVCAGIGIRLMRDTTVIAQAHTMIVGSSTTLTRNYQLPSSFLHVDAVAAGTYTYSIQLKSRYDEETSTVAAIAKSKLVVFEI